MCLNPKKRKRRKKRTHQWLERVWLVHFVERIRGQLITLTFVNLTANLSYVKVPCCALALRGPVFVT